MPAEIISALIAALVALITAGITGVITWAQIQRERTRWLADLKASYSVELYKARLAEYSRLFPLFGRLSTRAPVPLTPQSAAEVAQEINDWLYSAGGLVAAKSTRGALLALRDRLLRWQEGRRPDEIRVWRNAAMFALRRDLDILGLESFEPGQDTTLLQQLKQEMDAVSQ